jgi:hypothetical protein
VKTRFIRRHRFSSASYGGSCNQPTGSEGFSPVAALESFSMSNVSQLRIVSSREPVETQLPWFPFYVGDFLRRTMDMNATEAGAYIFLLTYYWEKDRLPAANDLARMARVEVKAWRAMKKKVLSCVRKDIPVLDAQKAKGRKRQMKAKGAANARWDAKAYADA